jgi:hypothetical protein
LAFGTEPRLLVFAFFMRLMLQRLLVRVQAADVVKQVCPTLCPGVTIQPLPFSRYILHLLRSPVGYVHLNAEAARALTQSFCLGRAALC